MGQRGEVLMADTYDLNLINGQLLKNIADAIREKFGTEETFTPQQMIKELSEIINAEEVEF